MRGHKIRYNYLHDIHDSRTRAVGGVSGRLFFLRDISGNSFYDVATPILIGGGRDNSMTNNMSIKCGRVQHRRPRARLGKGGGVFATKELIDLNYTKPPWSTRYPELLAILEDEPLAPKGNIMARNINWGGAWGWTEDKAMPLVKFEDNLDNIDPHFSGKPPEDFRLSAQSPALRLGFRQIPFEKIGVYKSSDRVSWPVEGRGKKAD